MASDSHNPPDARDAHARKVRVIAYSNVAEYALPKMADHATNDAVRAEVCKALDDLGAAREALEAGER